MKIEFKKSFLSDLKRIKEKAIKNRVREIIELIENAQNIHEIQHIKKLREGENYFRIRLGDYRVGLVLEGDTFILVRFLHRRELYRYFP